MKLLAQALLIISLDIQVQMNTQYKKVVINFLENITQNNIFR